MAAAGVKRQMIAGILAYEKLRACTVRILPGNRQLPHRDAFETDRAPTDERTYRRLKGAAASVDMRFADWIRARLVSAADVDLA